VNNGSKRCKRKPFEFCHEVATDHSPGFNPGLTLGYSNRTKRPESTPNPAHAGCNSKLAQYSKTPSPRVAGFEDEDENEAPHEGDRQCRCYRSPRRHPRRPQHTYSVSQKCSTRAPVQGASPIWSIPRAKALGYSVLPFHGKGLFGRHAPPISFRTYCGMACAGTPPASGAGRVRARIPRQYFRGSRPIPMMTSWLATKASSGPNA
jgi:hypothetical protein